MNQPPASQTTPSPSSFVAEMPEDARRALLALGNRRSYAPGSVVFLQGEASPGLCVVESGLLKISTISAGGREQILRHVGPNGSFNEVAALDGDVSPATVVAVEDSTVVIIPGDVLLEFVARSPDLAVALLRSLAGRMRHLVELVEDLSFRHVSERVARILLQSVAPHPGVGAGSDLRGRMTQREIAEMAGTSREVVARALKVIEASGAISLDRGEITLIAPERLSDLR